MTVPNRSYQAVISAPFGALGILMEAGQLTGIDFLPAQSKAQAPAEQAAVRAVKAIQGYFADPTQPFQLQLRLHGSEFQLRVWQRLRRIPAGRPMTYGMLAEELGTGPRAVGNACRANPCPLVVPCHRVVSASGLGGFAGQREGEKLAVKHWLLAHEGYRETRR